MRSSLVRARFSLVAGAFLVALVLVAGPASASAKTRTKLPVSINRTYYHWADFAGTRTRPVLTGTLKTSAGTRLGGKTVYLYRNGQRVASKKTSSRGVVKFSLKQVNHPDAKWQIKYKGSSKYRAVVSATKTTKTHDHYSERVGLGLVDATYRKQVTVALYPGAYGVEFWQPMYVTIKRGVVVVAESTVPVLKFGFTASSAGNYVIDMWVPQSSGPSTGQCYVY